MFLINLKYNSFEPISQDAWYELVVVNLKYVFFLDCCAFYILLKFLKDHIRQDKRLIFQLFRTLIEYKKDIKTVNRFLEKYGSDWLNQFSQSHQEFYNKNICIFLNNEKNSIYQKSANNIEYYNPEEFKIDNLVFIENETKFEEMLCYFDSHKIDVIGKMLNYKSRIIFYLISIFSVSHSSKHEFYFNILLNF
jgi:hypothetical protein